MNIQNIHILRLSPYNGEIQTHNENPNCLTKNLTMTSLVAGLISDKTRELSQGTYIIQI